MFDTSAVVCAGGDPRVQRDRACGVGPRMERGQPCRFGPRTVNWSAGRAPTAAAGAAVHRAVDVHLVGHLADRVRSVINTESVRQILWPLVSAGRRSQDV